jgi:ComF family protein
MNNEEVLCLRCYADLPRTRFHNIADNDVARIFWGRVNIVNATSFMFFSKDSRYRQIIHELKYYDQRHIGTVMGRLFGLELRDTPFTNVDIIHPVPLHPKKLRQRGYNQSELISNGLSEILQVPVHTNLIARTSKTKTQTKKSRYERWENVKDTFTVLNERLMQNKHILLVDDVITTGATIEACIQAVAQVSGVSVSVVSLAFAKLQ